MREWRRTAVEEQALGSIGKYFGDLHDPRTGNAKRHIFLEIPIIAICAMICGADGWVERLFQPLTHPHVLARGWQVGRHWTDSDEVESSRKSLARLVSGLLHRCRERVYLGLSELGESGFEQRGKLLWAFQKILQTPPENHILEHIFGL